MDQKHRKIFFLRLPVRCDNRPETWFKTFCISLIRSQTFDRLKFETLVSAKDIVTQCPPSLCQPSHVVHGVRQLRLSRRCKYAGPTAIVGTAGTVRKHGLCNGQMSVRLSVPFAHCSSLRRVCCCVPSG